MNASLQFRMSLGDLFQIIPRSRFRWSKIIEWGLAAYFLWFAWNSFRSDGVGWPVGIGLLAALLLVFQYELRMVGMWVLLAMWKTDVEVLVNDESISSGTTGKVQTILWSSFPNSGSFQESDQHFWLKFGRGGVCVPKRAFATSADVAAFRDFVAQRLGAPGSFTGLKEEATPDAVAHSL